MYLRHKPLYKFQTPTGFEIYIGIIFTNQFLTMSKIVLAIHGGAGTITKENHTDEFAASYQSALEDALAVGYSMLKRGETAISAITASIACMEDNELFNAGRGAVFTKKGLNEMDAAIMEGSHLEAGAVTGVRNIKNPIALARKVMEKSGHVILSGNGAKDFALEEGIEQASDDYFFTKYRYDQWVEIRDTDYYQLDHKEDNLKMYDKKFGTVGAVACDKDGNIAAGTSTGGMTNKRFGRIGDSPIFGAGTYANNKTCAISCTGHGEFFIRANVAYDVSCLMEYKGLSLQDACNEVVHNKLKEFGGEGGLIAVDARGNHQLIFNSKGMYRAFRNSDGESEVAMFGE